jgi:hypothetical protein
MGAAEPQLFDVKPEGVNRTKSTLCVIAKNWYALVKASTCDVTTEPPKVPSTRTDAAGLAWRFHCRM